MNLADKTIFNILAQSSGTILLLVSSIVFVRFLSQEEYGTFLQIMLVSNTVQLLGFMGLPQSIYYFFSTENRKDLFIQQTIIISILFSLFFSGLLWISKDLIVELFNNPLLDDYFWVVIVLTLLGFIVRLREPLLWSNGSLTLSAYMTVVAGVLQLGLPIVGVAFGNSLKYILWMMVLGNALSFLLHCVIYRYIFNGVKKKIVPSDDMDGGMKWSGFLRQLKYAFPIGLSSYVGVVGREMDKFFISSWFSSGDFAVYSRGAMEVPLVSTIRFTVNDIMMPKFVKLYKNGDMKDFLSQWHMIIEQVAKINFAIAALLFVLAPSLIRVLYTEKYMGAVPVFRIYLLLLVVGIAVYGMVPKVSGQTRFIFWAALLNLPINFILSYVLIKNIGITGPAIATVLANFITMGWLLKRTLHLIDAKISIVFPWKKLFGIALIAISSSALVFLTENLNPFNGMTTLVWIGAEMALYFCIYVWLLSFFDFLSSEEGAVLKRWFGPLSVIFFLRQE